MSKYLCNKIRCPVCEEVIQSYHIHDFKFCKCGSVAIDGGNDYLRRVSEVDWEELTILDDGSHETRRNNLRWSIATYKGLHKDLQIEWVLIKDLKLRQLKDILIYKSHIEQHLLDIIENELYYRKTL